MTMQEAMAARHTVRRYIGKPIPVQTVSALQERIAQRNKEHDLAIKMVTDDAGAFSPLIKLILAKGVRNYLLLAGPDGPDLDERLGYCGADLMLYAQTLGLNTWWVGGTFNRKHTAKLAPGSRVIGVIAIGYGTSQGTAHKSKRPEAVSFYEGAYSESPDWFRRGVNAALLAPTALNKQAFFIEGHADKVAITCENGIFSGADLGLVKYHFELGADEDCFRWE